MHAQIEWNGHRLRIDFSAGRSLAIPLHPQGRQPRFFTPLPMSAEPLSQDGFVGRVTAGGSCNVHRLDWLPHCHGTHTECIGHVLPEPLAVQDLIDPSPCLARLVTLPACGSGSRIPLQQVRAALESAGSAEPWALILRTLPNPEDKQWRDYTQYGAYPVLSPDAVGWLARQPLRHLLLDTPSLDAADDALLSNHRAWWGLDPADPGLDFPARRRSVTEFIFAADGLPDGNYWLHLELSPLQSEATPSRPMIYPVTALAGK